MSRSKHTRPDQIRASSRVRAPFEPRGIDDPSSFNRLARVLKESGIVLDTLSEPEIAAPILPRIITKEPKKDYIHPAQKSDILAVLEFFGERCFYGLKAIKLMQGKSAAGSDATMLMGRLEVPGTIILYDQPVSPWFVNGVIPRPAVKRLERAGAAIEFSSDNMHCLVHWTQSDLKNFMLFEVFMHEIGHHMMQQYKGKRGVRVARTKDHELFADAFARHCRESFFAGGDGDGDGGDGDGGAGDGSNDNSTSGGGDAHGGDHD